jgi:cleavage and polyadenylation specificity factor subunit 2
LQVFTLDDADAAFERFKSLKYSQHLRFSDTGRGAGVTITPYAAGHIIGSSLWRICWQTDDNDIVYAVSFNHRKEEHLNGGALETLSRPSIMITVCCRSRRTICASVSAFEQICRLAKL